MYLAAALAILITMVLALIRALSGPSVYDRVLAVTLFGTKTVLLLSVVSFLYGRTDFLDLALAYADCLDHDHIKPCQHNDAHWPYFRTESSELPAV